MLGSLYTDRRLVFNPVENPNRSELTDGTLWQTLSRRYFSSAGPGSQKRESR